MHAHVHVEVVVCKDSLLYVYVVTVFGINDDIALTKLLSLLHVLFSLLSVYIINVEVCSVISRTCVRSMCSATTLATLVG